MLATQAVSHSKTLYELLSRSVGIFHLGHFFAIGERTAILRLLPVCGEIFTIDSALPSLVGVLSFVISSVSESMTRVWFCPSIQ